MFKKQLDKKDKIYDSYLTHSSLQLVWYGCWGGMKTETLRYFVLPWAVVRSDMVSVVCYLTLSDHGLVMSGLWWGLALSRRHPPSTMTCRTVFMRPSCRAFWLSLEVSLGDPKGWSLTTYILWNHSIRGGQCL
jgi:hypothetical protein